MNGNEKANQIERLPIDQAQKRLEEDFNKLSPLDQIREAPSSIRFKKRAEKQVAAVSEFMNGTKIARSAPQIMAKYIPTAPHYEPVYWANRAVEVLMRPAQDESPDAMSLVLKETMPLIVREVFEVPKEVSYSSVVRDRFIPFESRGTWTECFFETLVNAYMIGCTIEVLPARYTPHIPTFKFLACKQLWEILEKKRIWLEPLRDGSDEDVEKYRRVSNEAAKQQGLLKTVEREFQRRPQPPTPFVDPRSIREIRDSDLSAEEKEAELRRLKEGSVEKKPKRKVTPD